MALRRPAPEEARSSACRRRRLAEQQVSAVRMESRLARATCPVEVGEDAGVRGGGEHRGRPGSTKTVRFRNRFNDGHAAAESGGGEFAGIAAQEQADRGTGEVQTGEGG